jgi:uncharacterized protein (TIGR03437 family)
LSPTQINFQAPDDPTTGPVPLVITTLNGTVSSTVNLGPYPPSFSFRTRPVQPGETLILYGVGFGPTNPVVPAGKIFSSAVPCTAMPQITIGGLPATVTFAGLIEAGLYQINLVVPNAGSGDRALQAQIGGMTTQSNIAITIR